MAKDEWQKEVEGISFIFQIKQVNGDGNHTWFPVSLALAGNQYFSITSKFDDRPNNQQVEENFAKEIKGEIERRKNNI